MVAEGDKVATRWTLRATHLGSFAGFAATGGRIEVSGITIHRAAGGLIVEAWVNWDTLSLRRQLQGVSESSTGAVGGPWQHDSYGPAQGRIGLHRGFDATL